MTTTYTVYSPASGIVYGRGLTATQAAQEILSWDSNDYDLRYADGAYDLFVTRRWRAAFGGDGGYVQAWSGKRLIRSRAATEAAAWEEVAKLVIEADWDRHPIAATDADYDAMMAGSEG